jgi:hypothetical protein
MARREPKRNLNREDEYWKLILAGIGPIAAAKRVGIRRRLVIVGDLNAAVSLRCDLLRQTDKRTVPEPDRS